jgi:hypothetical protein
MWRYGVLTKGMHVYRAIKRLCAPDDYNTVSSPFTVLLCTPRSTSPVGIVTGYGLDGPGIESRWGRRVFAHVQTDPGAHPDSCTIGTGYFPGVKRPGHGADHPPPPSAEVENE